MSSPQGPAFGRTVLLSAARWIDRRAGAARRVEVRLVGSGIRRIATGTRIVAATAGVAIVVAASATSAGAAYRADARLADWHGHPTWLAGRSQVSNGELIYDDYIYDDYGPDLNHHSDFPQFRDALAPKSGDFGYPKNAKRYGYNAADLREFRAGADRRGLHFLIALQTMK